MKIDYQQCEDCKFYKMIDSAFGHCIGIPPTIEEKPMSRWCRIKLRFGFYEASSDPFDIFRGYNIVAWLQHACRLFDPRTLKDHMEDK